jgi:hypothetical protein
MARKHKRLGWAQMETLYVGRVYKGRHARSTLTIHVVDVNLRGDPVVRNRLRGSWVMEQRRFLEFVSRAKDITNA